MKSILQDENNKECYLCRQLFGWHITGRLECHHIFGGGNRKNSEMYGLKVFLCHHHHNTPPLGVHFNALNMEFLRAKGQLAFEKNHTREEFIKIFGRNYL